MRKCGAYLYDEINSMRKCGAYLYDEINILYRLVSVSSFVKFALIAGLR